MNILDDLEPQQHVSLEPILPTIQIRKDFIVTYEISNINISTNSWWKLLIEKLNKSCEHIENFQMICSKRAKMWYDKNRFSFKIRVRFIEKEELRLFLKCLREYATIYDNVTIAIPKSHRSEFKLEYYDTKYENISKYVFNK